MKLIVEEAQDVQFISEGTGAEKKRYIHGVYMQSEIKNKNGRVYPRHLLEREVQRYAREYVAEQRALGELGHPSGPGINHDRAAILVTELVQDGNNFIGKARVLGEAFPMGRIVAGLIDEGIKFGVSSRGTGTLKYKDGCNYVQEDFKIAAAADVVHDPSAPAAFVNGIMEGVDWVQDEKSGLWIEQYKPHMKKMSLAELEEKMAPLFESFIASVTSNPDLTEEAIEEARRRYVPPHIKGTMSMINWHRYHIKKLTQSGGDESHIASHKSAIRRLRVMPMVDKNR